jgi:hypothetical protein
MNGPVQVQYSRRRAVRFMFRFDKKLPKPDLNQTLVTLGWTMVRGGGDNDNITLLRLEFFAAHAVHALSRLSPKGEEQDILRDIQNANHASKQEDAVSQAAGDLWKSKGKSV